MEKKTNYISDQLTHISVRIWKSKWYQILLFSLATFITLNLLGYYFGSFDQAIHIPFLKKYADPSLYPYDSFLYLRQYHYSFFWFLFIPFYKAGILEISMFVVYVAIIYFTFYALWKLSKTLFNNPLVSFLTVFIFIIPHIGFSGFTVFEFSLLNRTFILPFLLIAIDLYLNKRSTLAFFILGLMYNIHVISVNFILCMLLFDSLVNIKRIGIKTFFINILIFIAGALPVLIWRMQSAPVQITANWEWFKTISDGMLYHLFYFLGNNPVLPIITFGGISCLVLFFIAKRGLVKNIYHKTITNFILACCLILLSVVITSYFYPSVIIIESQIVRAGIYILIFSYLYFTGYVVELFQTKKITKESFYLLIAALIFSLSPIALLIVWLVQKFSSPKYRLAVSLLTIGSCFLLILFVSLKLDLWHPGVHIFPVKSPLYEVELWAKNNTTKNSVFIIPPQLWWFYTPDWRAMSERSALVTFYDLLEISFAPNYLEFWKRRFNDLTKNQSNNFRGNVFTNLQLTKRAYYERTSEDFMLLAKKYDISYLLSEKPYYYNLPIVYQNSEFILYDVRHPAY